MTEDQILQARILQAQADQERVDHALQAANRELGPEPCYARRKAHVVYCRALQKLATEMYKRLN